MPLIVGLCALAPLWVVLGCLVPLLFGLPLHLFCALVDVTHSYLTIQNASSYNHTWMQTALENNVIRTRWGHAKDKKRLSDNCGHMRPHHNHPQLTLLQLQSSPHTGS